MNFHRSSLLLIIFFIVIVSIGFSFPVGAQSDLGSNYLHAESEATSGAEAEIQSTIQMLGTPTSWSGQFGDPTTATEGAVFTAPESLQNEIDDLRDRPIGDLAPNAFVLASEDELYIVFTEEEPREGYATVEGQSPGIVDVEHQGLDFGVINADEVNFEEPSQLGVTEAYEDSEQYDRQYVEIDAHHRAVSIDYDEIDQSATAGVLVEEPIGDDLFDSFGERTQTLTDGIEGSSIDDDLNENVETTLGGLTQPRVVTSSADVEYWDDTEAAVSGIIAALDTPARDFIQTLQQNDPLPTDSNTPVLYVVDTEYDSQPVSSISEISEDPSSYDGQTVTFESNLYMTTVSSASVIQSATGTPIPIDVILHGGAAWDQLPEGRDKVVSIMGASSINQNNLTDTHRGTYQVTGEVVSTDRIEGDLPQGYILVAYDLERTGSLDTASVNDIIETQSSGVSDVLENQANPDVDASVASPDDSESGVAQEDQANGAGGSGLISDSSDSGIIGMVSVLSAGLYLSGMTAGVIGLGIIAFAAVDRVTRITNVSIRKGIKVFFSGIILFFGSTLATLVSVASPLAGLITSFLIVFLTFKYYKS